MPHKKIEQMQGYRTISLKIRFSFNTIVPNAHFLSPWKQNRKVFWCFQGVDKGYIGKEWVNYVTVFLIFIHLDLMKLKRQNTTKQVSGGNKRNESTSKKSDALISRYAAGMCFDFHPNDGNMWVHLLLIVEAVEVV